MARSCFLPDISCSAEEKAAAERLCLADGIDPHAMTIWTWTYPDGARRGMRREEWVAYLDAARALALARRVGPNT